MYKNGSNDKQMNIICRNYICWIRKYLYDPKRNTFFLKKSKATIQNLLKNFSVMNLITNFDDILTFSGTGIVIYSTPTSLAVNISSMTNTNCCEYSIKTPDDGQ